MRRVAGTHDALMVVRSSRSEAEPWTIIGKDAANETAPVDADTADVKENEDTQVPAAGEKRERSGSVVEEPQAKRARVSEASPCLTPPQDQGVKKLLDFLDAPSTDEVVKGEDTDRCYGAGDVFLTDGWRDRWCRCNNVSPYFISSYISDWFVDVVAAVVFSASHRCKLILICWKKRKHTNRLKTLTSVCRAHLFCSPNTFTIDICMIGLSLEELGMRALQRLPRERAIEGIMAFNAMRCASPFLYIAPASDLHVPWQRRPDETPPPLC